MSDAQVQEPNRAALGARLAIGFSQGVVLYGLWEVRESLPGPLFRALALAALFAPVVALAAVGAMRRRTQVLWLGAATLVTLGLGAYDGYVHTGGDWRDRGPWPRPALFVFSAAALFVAHHLILPAHAEGRWVASYRSYFDGGWKDGVRLVLSAAFVGALWILLWLGAALFQLIGLDFLEKLLREPGFAWPATTTFFAVAVHVTDVRAALVLGARTLALNLLAWLLPLMTLIAAGFLAALAFTGLEPLWQTRHAGGILLAAAAALIVLVNATYQDGERPGHPPWVLKWAVRMAAGLLAPLVLVAAYGLWLRIGQHGLTPGRIYALACLTVAMVYAGGYGWAAVDRRAWMRRLERVNVVAAHVVVLVLLAVFSPLADPARLSVADQVARLRSNDVDARSFDYEFLGFQAGRWGREALKELTSDPRPAVRERAVEVQQMRNRHDPPARTPEARRRAFEVLGRPLPDDFVSQDWGELEPSAGCPGTCPALVHDMDGDGDEDVVVFRLYNTEVYHRTAGRGWQRLGQLSGTWCPGDIEAVRAGQLQVRPPRGATVEVGGRPFVLVPNSSCPRPGGPP